MRLNYHIHYNIIGLP